MVLPNVDFAFTEALKNHPIEAVVPTKLWADARAKALPTPLYTLVLAHRLYSSGNLIESYYTDSDFQKLSSQVQIASAALAQTQIWVVTNSAHPTAPMRKSYLHSYILQLYLYNARLKGHRNSWLAHHVIPTEEVRRAIGFRVVVRNKLEFLLDYIPVVANLLAQSTDQLADQESTKLARVQQLDPVFEKLNKFIKSYRIAYSRWQAVWKVDKLVTFPAPMECLPPPETLITLSPASLELLEDWRQKARGMYMSRKSPARTFTCHQYVTIDLVFQIFRS